MSAFPLSIIIRKFSNIHNLYQKTCLKINLSHTRVTNVNSVRGERHKNTLFLQYRLELTIKNKDSLKFKVPYIILMAKTSSITLYIYCYGTIKFNCIKKMTNILGFDLEWPNNPQLILCFLSSYFSWTSIIIIIFIIEARSGLDRIHNIICLVGVMVWGTRRITQVGNLENMNIKYLKEVEKWLFKLKMNISIEKYLKYPTPLDNCYLITSSIDSVQLNK
ncbi:hypothetical protein BpHYR1_020475 [Brachionus plicatilis]|uniref:Uncharacterized protein n=1 Tax=Brachionus plicatilis TaxID=10195 RepID=A0A3M7Q1X9_BRAPC|nr:hypothetical protein BpHYR1_020475 [Brachionus plicatilis]